jgi:tetratricopeptide (TPR) repeat protein
MVTSSPGNESSTFLVQEGWDHLRNQRPLAAWASWQRALRVDPDSAVAAQALSTLESATDLALAARTPYRFRQPRDPARRAAWDGLMRGGNFDDLDAAAVAFDRLTILYPDDVAAWYNKALCLAWSGENLVSIGCLDRAVVLEAEAEFDDAVMAWTLAEVLRQGGGAETLADDLRFACTIAWDAVDTARLLHEFPEIRQVPTPSVPGTAAEVDPEISVFEWLDRPNPRAESISTNGSQTAIVLASVFIKANSLRLSSPRAENLERIEDQLFPRMERRPQSIRREATPLPLPFLDADLWIFRIAFGLDSSRADELTREAIEDYFENEWIHRKRKGLGDKSPLAAARDAQLGDAVARAKLTAVVRLREQLGSRVSTRALYKGYPFDRLRRRLGLECVDATAIDPLDLGCADPGELDRLDPSTLDEVQLFDAAASAAGLRDDARTARLAAELLSRQGRVARAADWKPLVSALVREAMSRDDPEAALSWIERARPMAGASTNLTFDVWRAEILARHGQGKAALETFRAVIGTAGPPAALDGALTLIDNGHDDEAAQLLYEARNLAREAGLRWIERRADQLLADGFARSDR